MRITFDEVRHAQTVADLRSRVAHLRATARELDAAGGRLRTEWSGAARDSWNHVQVSGVIRLAAMCEILTLVAEAASVAGTVLRQAECDVRGVWS